MNACSLPQAAAVLFLSIDASAAFSLTSKMTLSAFSTLFSSACSAPDVELPLHSAAEEEDAVDEAAALLGADSYAGSRCCTMSTSHPRSHDQRAPSARKGTPSTKLARRFRAEPGW